MNFNFLKPYSKALRATLLGSLLSLGSAMADPSVVGDGQAHLVEVQADGSLSFLDTAIEQQVYPESGVIEEYQEWVSLYDENHPDYAFSWSPQRVHLYASGSHDMLIPLGRFRAGEVEVKYSGVDSNGFFSGSAVIGHAWQNPNQGVIPDPNKNWVKEHSALSSWNKHPVKFRIGLTANNGWRREYFLQVDRLWAVDNGVAAISITLDFRNDYFASHNRDTLGSAINSIVPQPILENFKSPNPNEQYTRLSVNGSSVLTEDTISPFLSLSDDFVRQNELNSFFRSTQASFGTTPRAVGENNGIHITSTNSSIGGAGSRKLTNSFLTLSDPQFGQHLWFDPNQIYAHTALAVESKTSVELRAPLVFTSADFTVEGTLKMNSVQGDIPMGIYGSSN